MISGVIQSNLHFDLLHGVQEDATVVFRFPGVHTVGPKAEESGGRNPFAFQAWDEWTGGRTIMAIPDLHEDNVGDYIGELQRLDISFVKAGWCTVSALDRLAEACPQLQGLELMKPMEGNVWGGLQRFTGLQELSIRSSAPPTGRPLKLPLLERLEIVGIGSSESWEWLAVFQHLRSLSLVKVPGFPLQLLGSWKNFEDLQLYECNCDLRQLPELPKLRCLQIDEETGIHSLSFLAAVPNLRTLRLETATPLETLQGLEVLEKLERLELGYCATALSLRPLIAASKLRVLHLRVEGLSPDLAPISGLADLESCVLDCEGAIDPSPLSGLHHLQSLSLSAVSSMETFVTLDLPALRHLHLNLLPPAADLRPLSRYSMMRYLHIHRSSCGDGEDSALPLHSLPHFAGLEELSITRLESAEQLASMPQLRCLRVAQPLPDLALLRASHFLQSLTLDCQNLQNLDVLSGLRNLRFLELSACEGLEDLGPLAALTRLVELDISGCHRLSDIGALEGCTSLKHLSLDGVIDDSRPLAGLPALEELSFSSTSDVASPDFLKPLCCLRNLSFYLPGLQDIEPLRELVHLTRLYLCGGGGKIDLRPLAAFAYLEELICANVEVTSLDTLACLRSLEIFELTDVSTPIDLNYLAQCRRLRWIRLENCPQVLNLDALGSLPCLSSLNIINCNVHEVPPALRGHPGLSTLDVY